jgi:predicted transcriptional regulator
MSDTQSADTIPLAPELTARVRAIADRQGLPPEAALQRLLEHALAQDEREFQDTVAALRASLADTDAPVVALEDWRTQSQAWIAAHRRQETV